MANPPVGTPAQQLVGTVAGRLRYPWLFALLMATLAVDFFVPDPIPFVDEVVLALLTVFVGSWRARREPPPDASPETRQVGSGPSTGAP